MKSVELLVEEAVKAAIENDLERARSWLRQIDFVSLDAERTKARELVWGKASTVTRSIRPAQKTSRAPVRSADMFATFQRDRFTCRYAHCQRQTIYLPVLKELSRLFQDVLPYQKNWFPVQRHIVYWMWGTSLEHRVSFPFGGTSELSNLLTACYQCNDLKNYHQLENLGWKRGMRLSQRYSCTNHRRILRASIKEHISCIIRTHTITFQISTGLISRSSRSMMKDVDAGMTGIR